jgi:dihydropyrimidinase
MNRFVELTATRHARMYGFADRKGDIAIGLDADLAIWDTEREMTITAAALHDKVGYTPYEGRRIRGWPTTVLSRGRPVVVDGTLHAERGSGRFLARGMPGPVAAARAPSAKMGLFRTLIARSRADA